MMKTILLVIATLISFVSFSQTKAKAEKEFLAALNKLVANSKSQHWAYEEPFKIDSAFHIYGDTISATFKFKGDTSLYRIRYAAPVSKITGIFHDMYLIFSLKGKNVQMYERIGNEKKWVHFESRNYFHIALVETGPQMKIKQEIEDAWEKLSAYYDSE